MSLNNGESPPPVPATLEILLERGEDPNVLPRVRAPGPFEAPSPWVIFARSTKSVFNMLSGPLMFPALRWNASLDNALFDLLMSHGADPNTPLLDRRGAHTVFSHFLKISASRFLGEGCFDGYLRTLDAFFRAGASLGVPLASGAVDPDAEAAFGNLARSRPEESVLASHCAELKGLNDEIGR
ncbi:hypothetical protein F4779DRAFT_97819 [Xylariaceae sp. FL0662B]|nr:hypothetical protein F4779DRAFT_97819 [Xylariaceae sp. FL0662B]